MATLKKKAGALFLAALMVTVTLLSSCEANNEVIILFTCFSHSVTIAKCAFLMRSP
jgi:hypothetical protein